MDRNPRLGTRGRPTTKKKVTRRKERENFVLFRNGSPAVVVYCIFLGDVESEVMTCSVRAMPKNGPSGQVCVSAGAYGRRVV